MQPHAQACRNQTSGEIEQYELIKDVSTKVMIVSDVNDTETSSFGVINSENEVKNQFA